MKKQIALLLSLLLLAPGFTACGETRETAETDAKTSAPDGSQTNTASDAEPVEPETEDPYRTALSGLEQGDFEGHVFEILVRIVDNRNFASAFKAYDKIAAKEIEKLAKQIAALDY